MSILFLISNAYKLSHIEVKLYIYMFGLELNPNEKLKSIKLNQGQGE